MDNLSEATGEVRLSGPLTIRRAAELRDELLTSLTENQAIVLDIDQDADADISVVQLILAAQVSARASGKEISLKAASAGPLLEVLRQAGFLAADDAGFWTNGSVTQ